MYASYIARNPDRLYDVTWEGLGYRRTTKEGATGIVMFSKHGAVGAFFDPASPNNPKDAPKTKKPALVKASLADQTKGIGTQLAGVARRDAFPAMVLDGDDPSITAVFWSDPKGAIVGARPMSAIESDGAHLVSPELSGPEGCIAALGKTYAFDEPRTQAVLDTFLTKAALAQPANARVTISNAIRDVLGIVPNNAIRELLTGAGIELA